MAIGGIVKTPRERIEPKDVLEATHGGYDIYRLYIGGKLGKLMKRPWGKDKKKSWGIFPKAGNWLWKDQAWDEKGNAIQFVQKMFGLSFPEAMNKIITDFGLDPYAPTVNASPVYWQAPEIQEKEYMHISFTSKKWGKEHHKYYENTEVTEVHAVHNNVFAVKDCAINHVKVKLHPNEVVWAYWCEAEQAVKLYFPHRLQENKFRNNVSGTHLWNFDNIVGKSDEQREKVLVQKSVKDMLVTLLLTPDVIATQSELYQLFDREQENNVVEDIETIAQYPWIFYGSDEDGMKKSQKIVELTGWNRIYTPEEYLPEINDTYGMAKKHGLRALEDYLKQKHVL